MKIKKILCCDYATYKIGRSSRKGNPTPIVLIVSDGNIEDYDLKLTAKAVKKLGKKLIEAADLLVVSQVMET